MASPVRTPAAAAEPARRPSATAPPVRLSAPPGVLPATLPAPVREAVVDTGGGTALSPEVSAALRRGLGVDPSPVRVHTGARAAAATTHLGVRAFTWGSHVFLGPGERADDVGLLAHEVAHAIQQSGGAAVQLFDGPHGVLEAEAHSAAGAVLAGRRAQVRGRTYGPVVQGLFDWARKGLSAVGSAISSAASAVVDVGAALRDKILGFIKDKAAALPGYDLLAFILERDPITQQPVPRTAVTLVRAVLGLVPGGLALFENLQKANVIQRAFDWLAVETAKLGLTWSLIRAMFARAWDELSLSDLASPSGAWEKLKNIFGAPLRRLADFAVAAGRKVLELVFEGALALAGSAGQQILAIFRRVGAVFSLIVADPLKFLGNLLSAVKGGFGKFKDNILAHLRTGLFEWLLGSLEGVTLPKAWDFAGILHLVLQILGLTYTALRAVLVKLIGEPAVAAVEKVFDFLVLVVTKGLGAAWDKIKEFATDLADQVIGGIRDWVAKSVVGAAVTKLVTMFNPVGAIIQGIITIYNTVMFFIERAQQIARLVNSVLDSVENIARGNLSGAIAYVERTMANTLPVILGFLARLLGLGNVTKYVRDIITKIRATIASALEKVGLWIKDKVKALLAGKQSASPPPAGAGDTPQATAVKADAVQDLKRATAEKKLDTTDQLHELLTQTVAKFRPRGLQALSARVADEATLNISISAFASQPQSFILPWAEAFRAHPPKTSEIAKLRRAFQSQGYETYAAVSIDGRLIEAVTSGTAGHAEQRLLGSDIWSKAIAQAKMAAQAKGSSELAILINRSPCTLCAPKLVDALNAVKGSSPGVRFLLAATGDYQPSREPSEQEIEADAKYLEGKMGISLEEAFTHTTERAIRRGDSADPTKGGATTTADIGRLQGAGWQLQLLLARSKPTYAGKQWLEAIEHAAKSGLAQRVTAKNSQVK